MGETRSITFGEIAGYLNGAELLLLAKEQSSIARPAKHAAEWAEQHPGWAAYKIVGIMLVKDSGGNDEDKLDPDSPEVQEVHRQLTRFCSQPALIDA